MLTVEPGLGEGSCSLASCNQSVHIVVWHSNEAYTAHLCGEAWQPRGTKLCSRLSLVSRVCFRRIRPDYSCKCPAVLLHVVCAREESLHYVLRVLCSKQLRRGRDDYVGGMRLPGCSQARSSVQWEEPRAIPGLQVQPPQRPGGL